MDSHPVTPASGPPAPRRQLLDAYGRPYEPAIGPRLKVLLGIIFACVAVLGATGVYLLAIRGFESARDQTYTNQFTLWMFIVHVLLGVALVLPFLYFGFTHLASVRRRKNRRAVRLGIILFIVSIVVGVSGLALIQLDQMPQLPTGSPGRWVVWGLHALAPVAAVVIYVLHRRAGPDIKWSWGIAWGVSVGVFVVVMGAMHSQDPRKWYATGSPEGAKYFEPAKIRTPDANFIPASVLMMDHYCLECHQDVYNDHFHSAHKFSSFNNPPYRFSVRETRKVSVDRDGHTRPSRWCAGCHDPVVLLSGQFDNINFDDVNDPTAHAGITCTVCHAVTNINSTLGNADVTIEEPIHYPGAFSDNPLLKWLNKQVVKAKPDFHSKTFLKPLHRTAEFCSTCHKVSLPPELTFYKEFLRGQNHYDPYLLSGVSGVGSRSFYYPAEAKTNCAECHMPLLPSNDRGTKDFDGSGVRKRHDHTFLGANTGLMHLLIHEPRYAENRAGFERAIQAHTDFLRGTDPDGKDQKVRIDIFGLEEGGTTDVERLVAPIRPNLPRLKPGTDYLVEVVVRTLNIGHPFPQGTADSNEIWVDFLAKAGGRVIGRNGALSGPDDSGRVDEWSHFINVLMLDRNGNRINRRNPQDIFTPLYDHQIPPGAAAVVHYKLHVPKDVTGPVEIKVRLRYRKFDFEYLSLVYEGDDKVPKLPIVDMCADAVTLPVEGVAEQVPEQASPIKPAWQRWNDYGIGCYLEGGAGSKKGELKQAEIAFNELLKLPDKDAHGHGYLNLARVLFDEGRLGEAVKALNAAQKADKPAPWWTVAWFNGLVNVQNGHLDEARKNFEQVLDPTNQPRERKFDFARDFVVINELAATLFRLAQQEIDDPEAQRELLRQAVRRYERTLEIEPEDLDAHYGLAQCFSLLGEATPPGKGEVTTDRAALQDLAKRFADGSADKGQRLQAASWLGDGIPRFGEIPTKPDQPKLPVFLALIKECRPVYDADDAELRWAAARVLGRLYRQTHLIFKPDENAKDRTVRLYRAKHPAADAASQAIIIYPTDRPDSPGRASK